MADLRYWAMLDQGVQSEALVDVDIDGMIAHFRAEIARARQKKAVRLPLSLLPLNASFETVIALADQRDGRLSAGQLQHLVADSFPRVYSLKDTPQGDGRIAHVAVASAFWTTQEIGLVAVAHLDISDIRSEPSSLVGSRLQTYAIERASEAIPEEISRALEGIYSSLQTGITPVLSTSAPRPRRALVMGPEKPVLPHVSRWAQKLQGTFYLRGLAPVFYLRPGEAAKELMARIANEEFDLMVSWQPSPSRITHELHEAFNSAHTADQLMVIEDATFDAAMHSIRGELDARIALWSELVPEHALPGDPADVEEALRQAAAQCTQLRFSETIFEQGRKMAYPQPRRIRDDVIAFDGILREISQDRAPAGRLDQIAATRGVDFSRFISPTQARSGAYDIRINGVLHQLGPHLKFGRGLPKNIARVYMVEVADGEYLVCDIRPH